MCGNPFQRPEVPPIPAPAMPPPTPAPAQTPASARSNAAQRQRGLLAGDTNLTGGRGLLAEAPVGKKTLLGQ